MIDLHTHILPGVDDGSKTVEDAVAFARLAVEDGTRKIVATPHCKEGFYFNTRAEIIPAVESLQKTLDREKLNLELIPGAEVHLAPDLVQRVKDGRAPTLADNGKTLLLELSLTQPQVELPEIVFQLKLAGLVVLFAHPERIKFFSDDISRYERLIEQGAYGQLTTSALTGRFGANAQKFGETLLKRGLVHVLASDGHNVSGRSPEMSPGLEVAASLVGERYAEAMVTDAPQAILEGRAPELPPIERPKKKSFFGKMFGSS